MIEINAETGALSIVSVDNFNARPAPELNFENSQTGMGRELFSIFRNSVGSAENGASIFSGGNYGDK